MAAQMDWSLHASPTYFSHLVGLHTQPQWPFFQSWKLLSLLFSKASHLGVLYSNTCTYPLHLNPGSSFRSLLRHPFLRKASHPLPPAGQSSPHSGSYQAGFLLHSTNFYWNCIIICVVHRLMSVSPVEFKLHKNSSPVLLFTTVSPVPFI